MRKGASSVTRKLILEAKSRGEHEQGWLLLSSAGVTRRRRYAALGVCNHEADVFDALISGLVGTYAFSYFATMAAANNYIRIPPCSLVVLLSICNLLGGIQGQEATGIKIEMWLVMIGTRPSLYSCG